MKEIEIPHKPLFNSIISILFIVLLILITSKSQLLGLFIVLLSAIIIIAYIQEDNPENYITIKKT